MTRAAMMHQATNTWTASTHIQRTQQSWLEQAYPLMLALRAHTTPAAAMQIIAYLHTDSTAVVWAEHPCTSKMPNNQERHALNVATCSMKEHLAINNLWQGDCQSSPTPSLSQQVIVVPLFTSQHQWMEPPIFVKAAQEVLHMRIWGVTSIIFIRKKKLWHCLATRPNIFVYICALASSVLYQTIKSQLQRQNKPQYREKELCTL